jgi:hypothetical protein
LYEIAERAGVEARRVQVYKTDLNTMAPVQEVLEPLMLEMGAPESLSPEHVELAARTGASVATSFAVGRTPPRAAFLHRPGETRAPRTRAENPPADSRLRHFGRGRRLKLDELRNDDTGRTTTERGQGTEFTAGSHTVLSIWRYGGPTVRRAGHRTQPGPGNLSVLIRSTRSVRSRRRSEPTSRHDRRNRQERSRSCGLFPRTPTSPKRDRERFER